MTKQLLLLLTLLVLSGCLSDYNYNQEITKGYSLGAMDEKENMSLYVSNDGYDVGIVSETVFAVGYNDSFIIVKQHPNNNRSITNHYIIPLKYSISKSSEKNVIGPLIDIAYQAMIVKLNIVHPPAFKIVFSDLE